jgi:hypothetical protein
MNNESDGNTFRDEGDIKNNELSNINMNIVYEEVEK